MHWGPPGGYFIEQRWDCSIWIFLARLGTCVSTTLRLCPGQWSSSNALQRPSRRLHWALMPSSLFVENTTYSLHLIHPIQPLEWRDPIRNHGQCEVELILGRRDDIVFSKYLVVIYCVDGEQISEQWAQLWDMWHTTCNIHSVFFAWAIHRRMRDHQHLH